MALVVADRVRETCSAPGTGTVTLLGAATGYQAFSVIGNGNTTYYTIADQTGANWEVGIGTYTSSGTTLSRDTVLASSNGGSKTNFSSGTQDVFVTYPSEQSVYVSGSSIVPSTAATLPIVSGGTGASTAPAGMTNLIGFTSTPTAGATTTLTNTSSYYQVFTGSSNQTVQLPATSTLSQGWSFHIVNNSSGTLTVQTSTAVSLGTVPPGVTAMPTALTTTGNTATDWEFGYTDFSTLTGTGSVVLSTSPTLTTPNLGTPSAATLTNATGLPLSTGVTGTLGVGNGGTGSTTLTLNNVLLGNGTSALQVVAPGANGNLLTSNGTTWTSAAPPSGGASISNDTTTASNEYPLFAAATTGTPTTIYTSNSKLLYKPSTGEFQAFAPVASNGINVNNTTAAANYTIAASTNGLSVGPISVSSGVSITITSGQRWVVI